MCLQPYHLKYQTFDGSWRESDVPCGKCPECIRRAQSDMMILVARQLRSAVLPSWFVTLSYKDDKLPLAYVCTKYSLQDELAAAGTQVEIDAVCARAMRSDVKDLTFAERSRPYRLSRAPFRTYSDFDKYVCSDGEDWCNAVKIRSRLEARENAIRAEYSRRFHWHGFDGRNARSVLRPGCVLELGRRIHDGFLYVYTVCTTVDRKDVQLWLKSSRVAYERRFGKKLPDFKYVLVQEYGPRGHRPHYHMIFTDILESDLYFILERWSRVYCGNPKPVRKKGSGVVYDRILEVSENGNNAAASAGKYLGCYMKKLAAHDEKPMIAGLCVRPRKCGSKFFGVGSDFEALRSYLLGFDVFQRYDVDDPSTYPDVEQLLEVVKRRQKYPLSFSPEKRADLAIPNYLKSKIYKGVKQKVSFRKVYDGFTPLSFHSYCESSGFARRPFHKERVLCSYPCSSELSQGLADLEAFRADLLYQEELYAFACVQYDPFDLPPDIPSSVLVSFADYKANSRREKWICIESELRKKYVKSQF